MGLAELVVGLGQAVRLHPARDLPELLHEQPPRDREGEARHPGGRQLIGGLATDVLGDHIRAAAHGQVGHLRDTRGLHGDVGGGVADAEHQDALVDEALVGLAVPVGVKLVAGERVLAREGRLREARVPVVAVGHEHGLVIL